MHFIPPSESSHNIGIKFYSGKDMQQIPSASLPCLDAITEILNPDKGNLNWISPPDFLRH